MPNAFTRFRRMAGWTRTIILALVFVLLLSLAGVAIAKGDLMSPAVWYLPGLLLGVALRPVLLANLLVSMKVLNSFWVVYIVYTLGVHKALGKPHWSDCVIYASAGAYMAGAFVFYSSKLLYIVSCMAETDEQRKDQDSSDRS